MVLRDERAVIPIGSYNATFGVTLSLPSIVGRSGVVQIFEPEMAPEEQQALVLSATNLRKRKTESEVAPGHALRPDRKVPAMRAMQKIPCSREKIPCLSKYFPC